MEDPHLYPWSYKEAIHYGRKVYANYLLVRGNKGGEVLKIMDELIEV
jgi:hypothetical protein